jgi:hypothetical protein
MWFPLFAPYPRFLSVMLQGLSDGSTLTDEIQNYEEKISVLESTVKKLEMELKNEKNEKETDKKASDLKLEELGEKIKVIIYIRFFFVALKVAVFMRSSFSPLNVIA